MKRNSPESSHSRPERQQESRIEGVKTIGIISTPIIWPVKQRPPRFSGSSADENLERKDTYSLFRPTVSTSSASEETSSGTLAAFTENIDLDNTMMNQLPNENILNDSRVSSDSIYNAADDVADHSVDAAVPLLQNRGLTAEEAWSLTDGLHYADSESTFRLPISRSAAYELREEALWISSSNNDTLNFMHINDVLKPDSWNETVFHHHVTSDIKEEKYHSLSSLSISPMKERPLLKKSRQDLLDFAPQNVYSEMIEGETNRKYFSMLAANSEFQFTTSMYIKEHYSEGFTKSISVDMPHTNPTTSSNNMKKTYTEIMPDSQLTSSVTGYSREQLMSALAVGTSWANSAFKHVVATLPAYQQSLMDMSLESDSIFMSNTDYWSNYLKYSAYVQKRPSETPRKLVLENNLDAFHSKSEESGFSILESENINRVGISWKPGYLDFPTKYLDISPSLTSSFWTVSYHLKVFSGESSKKQLVSFNKLLSNPTERLLSISSPTKSNNISEQDSTVRLLDHIAEEMNSSHARASERQIFGLFNPGLSRRISEGNDKTISQLQSTVNFANLTVSSRDELYFDFLFPSLEAPLHHHSVQISPFDKVLANSMEKLMFHRSLHMQGGTDVIKDRTNVTVLNNRQQLASVLITRSGIQPSCLKDSQTVCLVSTLVNSLVNSTRTRGLSQFESILENDTVTNTDDNARSEVQIDAGFFIKNNSSVSSDLFITTLSLELKQPLHSDSKFRVTVPPNSYSTPPLPLSLQNHLDTISPSLTPGWGVAELSLPTTEITRSLLTVLDGNNSFENQDNSIRYSARTGEQEIIGDNNEKKNAAVLTSTNKSRLSDQNLEGEVYGSFSKHREGISSLNIFSTPVLDFENTDYGHFSSLLVSSRTAIINDLPSSYSGITIQHKETILNLSLMTPGAAIHDSHMYSQMQVSPAMYHQPSVLSRVHSLTNLSSETGQNTTLYPPLNQLTSTPTVLLSCTFTELGCLCRPEINCSMSSY